MKKYITDLETIKRLSQKRSDEFEILRYTIEFTNELSDEELDSLVDEIAEPIVTAIDCTKCGNCCRSLPVHLTPTDINRLSHNVNVYIDDILTQYVDQEGEWSMLKTKPCAFLRGSLCSIYEHRPESCRLYPQFTPDFRWTMEYMLEGIAICPIIYNVFSELVEKVEELW